MRKRKIWFIPVLVMLPLLFTINAYAASAQLVTSSNSVYVGDSFTVSVNVFGAAAWEIHTSVTGPASGCIINEADSSSQGTNVNQTFTATCTATGTGTINIKFNGNVISETDENATDVSGSQNVTVTTRPPANNNTNNNPTPSNPTTNNGNKNNNTNNNTNNPTTNNQPTANEENKSTNNNIKELTVDSFNLEKIDNNNYSLTVPNNITSININATAEDSKATVTGAGNHPISIGDNKIEIIITSEAGTQNTINISVTRKESFTLEDLNSLLESNDTEEINISIDENTVIKKEELEKIKNKKKTVNFNHYDNDKNLLYSIIIDGKKLSNINDLSTTLLFSSDYENDILRLSNYADGMFVNLKKMSTLPNGMKIKVYVGNKFRNNEIVNIYKYKNNDDQLALTNNNIVVQDGYITFDVIDSADYYITKDTIKDSVEEIVEEKSQNHLIEYIIIGIIYLSLIGVIIKIRKNIKKKA